MSKTKVAVIGSGNIGTDLMIKLIKTSKVLDMAAMVGIDPASDGLKRARDMGVATTHEGETGPADDDDDNCAAEQEGGSRSRLHRGDSSSATGCTTNR